MVKDRKRIILYPPIFFHFLYLQIPMDKSIIKYNHRSLLYLKSNAPKKRLKEISLGVLPEAFSQASLDFDTLWQSSSIALWNTSSSKTIHYRFTTLVETCFQVFNTIFFITYYPCIYCWYCYIKYYFWSWFSRWLQQYEFAPDTIVMSRGIR